MRALLIIVLVGIVLFAVGWLTFQRSPGQASVTLETSKVQQDVNRATQKGAEALDHAADSLKEQTSELREKTSPSP